jgi:hypothetical protein
MSKIIEALEQLEPGKFHALCDELLSDEYGYKGILPLGINKKNKTISGTPDSIVFQGKEATFFEYSTNEDFARKIKEDLEKVKNKASKLKLEVNKFVFVTNRERRKIKNLTPEEYIKEKYSWKSHIIDIKALENALNRNRNYHIRRKYLNIDYDFFISREKFEKIYISRMKKSIHYSNKFHNREKEFRIIKKFLKEHNEQILVIHSNGGLGKTRLILEVIKSIEKKNKSNIEFLLNDPYQNNIRIIEHLHEISSDKTKASVIILDDCHKILQLNEFKKLLSEKDEIKIVINTRTGALENIESIFSDFPLKELKISPLKNEYIRSQLCENIRTRIFDEALDYITYYCKGNPLISEMFANIINEGKAKNLDELINCDPLKEYFDRTLLEFESIKTINERYKPYLAIIHLIKPLSIEDEKLRRKMRKLLNIDYYEETSLLRNLENSNLIEKVGPNLNIYPDLLGEHIVKDVFFSDNVPLFPIDDLVKILSYEKYESLIRSIAIIKTDKSKIYLASLAEDIERIFSSKNNDKKIKFLKLLEIFAYHVPDITLRIIRSIIQGDIVPPKEYKKPFSFIGAKHINVLEKCIDLLELIKFELFNDVIECLSDLYLEAKKKNYNKDFKEKIFEQIDKAGKYDIQIMRQKGYLYQKKLYEKMSTWKSENSQEYFPLIIRISKTLLSPEAHYQYSSPLEPNKLHIGRPLLFFNEELKIRIWFFC